MVSEMSGFTMMDNPMVMSGFCDLWPSRHWTFESLSQLLGDTQFDCRISLKSCCRTMETECMHERVTVDQFHQWIRGRATESNLDQYPRTDFSCYIDYKYMKDVFSEHPQMFQQVVWKEFGLGNFDGKDSTIWLSSEGANTPGHQDTYGFNLVTQLVGRKLWILFPPEDTRYLYATRVPYEESSVFTQVNVRRPIVELNPEFQKSHPVVIVLHPGQTLYVPRHWWHYVESLDPAISVNVWVPVEEDRDSQLHEAVTRFCASSLIQCLDTGLDSNVRSSLLNPTETLYPADVNFGLLRTALLQAVSNNCVSAVTSPLQEDGHNPATTVLRNVAKTKSTKVEENMFSRNEVDVVTSQKSDVTEMESPRLNERLFSTDKVTPMIPVSKNEKEMESAEEANEKLCSRSHDVNEGESHFQSFVNTIKNYEISFCESPYGFGEKDHSLLLAKRTWGGSLQCSHSLSKQRKLSSEISRREKKDENDDNESRTGHSIRHPKLESETVLETSVRKGEDSCSDSRNEIQSSAPTGEHKRKIVSVKPCTFSSYLQFLDELCEYSKCRACRYHRIKHRATNDSGESGISDCVSSRQPESDTLPVQDSDVFSRPNMSFKCKMVATALSSSSLPCDTLSNTTLPTKTNDNIIETDTTPQSVNKVENSTGSLDVADKKSDNDVSDSKAGCSRTDERTFPLAADHIPDLNRLSDREIAESFLVSVLHPDIITEVVSRFKEQCTLCLKGKDKEEVDP
ncbi:HSPB1-associated protein 1 [Aplysia californica]|uniref:HSPB1-associated protein 1 n=1 Tax=Aplysia californica TaxID=6500 RepID=A0ABM0JKC6_APLCA|nr:HSPB1-associated protein 1 [Aplysia californica]